jgi:hypothetical protein
VSQYPRCVMLLPYVACDAKKEFPGLTADRPGIFILGNTTNEYRWQWAEDAMIITIIRTMILFLLVVLVVLEAKVARSFAHHMYQSDLPGLGNIF